MPEWNQPPKTMLDDALEGVLYDLEQEVSGNPSFESVAGLPMKALTEHAARAIGVFLDKDPTKLGDPTSLFQVYCLGFVVGTKYGERRKLNPMKDTP